jgi:hypothetical protein
MPYHGAGGRAGGNHITLAQGLNSPNQIQSNETADNGQSENVRRKLWKKQGLVACII